MTRPTVFYKYTSADITELVLKTSRLRWSSPVEFNDLAEFRRMPIFEPTIADAHRLLPGALMGHATGRLPLDESRLTPSVRVSLSEISSLMQDGVTEDRLLEILSAYENKEADSIVEQGLRAHMELLSPSSARVLCLTSSASNEVMWGTYAQSHTGCVLGFTAALDDSPFHEAAPVSYSTTNQAVGSGLDFLLYGSTPELRRRTREIILYGKKACWSYEQEWRMITWRPAEAPATHGDYKFEPRELESVTIGARINPEIASSICRTIHSNYPKTRIFRMTQSRDELVRLPVPEKSEEIEPNS